jgi:hypothetical protein
VSDAGALVGLLAEEDRLRVAAAVALGAGTTDEVVAATGMTRRRVVQALERLAGGGLVVAEDGRLRVAVERFKDAARTAAQARPTVSPEALGATPEQAGVLRNFLVDGRLVAIPAQRAKRLQVLDFLAQQFEPGKAYPERDVNFVLGRFHRDYAALRRYLVDEEFLERRDSFYWRAGGTFDVEA